MTREIKFRAWEKKEKEYYYDAEYTYDFQCSGRGCYADSFGDILAHPEKYEVEQYTGLKDKNGKEIYEGDIVKIWSGERSELSLGGSQYHLEHYPYTREVKIDSRGVYIEYPGYMLLRNFADLEVIGNIHENPELLEKGE